MSGARKRWKHGQGVYKRMLESTKNELVIESIRTGTCTESFFLGVMFSLLGRQDFHRYGTYRNS